MRFFIAMAAFLSMLAHALPAFAQQPVEETEPNNTPATADTALLGGVVTGHPPAWSNDDPADYWVVFANAGDTIYASLEGCEGCGDGAFYLYLYAADGTTVLDARQTRNGNDPQLSYVATVSGSYFVRVWFSADDASAPIYTITFRERKCPADANEPNDTRATARRLTLPSVIDAIWCPGPDPDFYRIDVQAGTVLEFSLENYTRYTSYDSDGGLPFHLFGPNGEPLDSLVTDDIGPLRFTAPSTGTYFLQPWSNRGGLRYSYRLSVRSAGQVPLGPGDPPIIRLGGPDIALWDLPVDRHGDFWIGPLTRMSIDGTLTSFGNSVWGRVAWDPWGNMLVLNSTEVFRFALPDRKEHLFDVYQGAGGMAIASDGLWVANGWDGKSHFYKYSFDGRLLESYQLSDLRSFEVVLGPSGEPYFASDNAIYRLNRGHPELVLKHEDPSEITGFAFDILGNIYVADQGFTWRVASRSGPRVSLHDATGAVVVDSFAWWPRWPRNPTFGRNADGTTNSRLFIVDDGRFVELNPAGVRAPGRPVQPTATCPVYASEAEPNDAAANAQDITVDTTVTGVSCMAGDADFFRFTASRTQQLSLEVEGADEPTLELLAADGRTRLAFSETPASRPRINHGVEAGKTYFVRVASWFGGPNPYTLRVGTALTRPEGLTLQGAARELFRPSEILNAAQRTYLDQLGNNDGRYDVGDFRTFLRRERAASGSRP